MSQIDEQLVHCQFQNLQAISFHKIEGEPIQFSTNSQTPFWHSCSEQQFYMQCQCQPLISTLSEELTARWVFSCLEFSSLPTCEVDYECSLVALRVNLIVQQRVPTLLPLAGFLTVPQLHLGQTGNSSRYYGRQRRMFVAGQSSHVSSP